MEKYNAFLVAAHHDWYVLEQMLKMLDDERNDIYLHIDKKSLHQFDKAVLETPRQSDIYMLPSLSVTWGGYSQIQCTLELLKQAMNRDYHYYHLISGVDLPLKTPGEMIDYLKKDEERNFITYEYENVEKGQESYLYKIRRYHLLQEKMGRPWSLPWGPIEKCLLAVQKILRINRLKNIKIEIYHGSCWFSITRKMAEHIIRYEPMIKKIFSYGICVDELFVQSIAKLQKEGNIVENNLRLIDWTRGTPYIYSMKDYQELITQPEDIFFARKFDSKKDKQVIDTLREFVLKRK